GWEKVTMDLAFAAAIEVSAAEIGALRQRHVALRAPRLGLGRIVKAAGPHAGDPAEQVRIVMVLAAEELLVVIQRHRQADLVTGRAELGRPVERLEEHLLVKIG